MAEKKKDIGMVVSRYEFAGSPADLIKEDVKVCSTLLVLIKDHSNKFSSRRIPDQHLPRGRSTGHARA